jgi:hypothetical protein
MLRSSDRIALLLAIAAALARPRAASAQTSCPDEDCIPRPPPGADLVPDLAVLKTPASPAAMVLGVAETQIQRPTTPTGLAFALASGVSGQVEQKPLDNFAVEVTPYWLFDHPRLTAGDVERSPFANIFRNISLSLATAGHDEPPTMEGGEPLFHRELAGGLRVSLLSGHPSQAALACERYFDAVARAGVSDLGVASVEFNRRWEAENPRPVNPLPRPGPTASPAERAAWDRAQAETRERLQQWAARKEAAKNAWMESQQPKDDDPVLLDCLDTAQQRVGWLLDGATAYSFDFPAADLGRLDDDGARAFTGWATLAYLFDNHVTDRQERAFAWSLMGTGRTQREWRAADADVWRIDGGGRVVVAWERYGASGEGALRWQRNTGADESDLLWRAALTLDYRLSSGTWVSATFGKDFGESEEDEPLLALANLEWNIGRDRGVRPDTAGREEPE